MRKRFVTLSASVVLTLAVAIAACGKSSTPASPSAATPAAAAKPSAPVTGAVIAGTVMTAAGTASVRASGAAMSVSIAGTAITALVDGSGRFTLQNVPTGDVTLNVSGNGVNASLTITAVSDHEQIDIVINVSGNSADADETERKTADQHGEVEGRIAAITAATRTLTVGRNQTMLVVPVGTPIHHGSTSIDFSQLAVGERIHAHATMNGNTFTATDVEVQNEHTNVPPANPPPDNDHGNDNEAEVGGTVAGAAAGHACPAFTFSVGTTVVTTTASTKFADITCAGVVNGIAVEVKGTRTAANALTATKIEKK